MELTQRAVSPDERGEEWAGPGSSPGHRLTAEEEPSGSGSGARQRQSLRSLLPSFWIRWLTAGRALRGGSRLGETLRLSQVAVGVKKCVHV